MIFHDCITKVDKVEHHYKLPYLGHLALLMIIIIFIAGERERDRYSLPKKSFLGLNVGDPEVEKPKNSFLCPHKTRAARAAP